MYQIVFNEISAAEVAKIPTLEALQLFSAFRVNDETLHGAQADDADAEFGVVERGSQRIYRFRSQDYRIYFTVEDGKVIVQRVLHADSVKDFFFRSGIGNTEDEDQKLGRIRSFWKLIDEAVKAPLRVL